MAGRKEKDTRDRILDAALELFARDGVEATSTRALAERAGVNEVTLFRHFGTKEGILEGLVQRETDLTARTAGISFEPTADPVSDLRKFGNIMRTEMNRRSGMLKMMLVETGRKPEVFRFVKGRGPFEVVDMLEEYFARATAMGFIACEKPRVAALAFFSFHFRSFIATTFMGGDLFEAGMEDVVPDFCRMLVDGMKPAAVTRGTASRSGARPGNGAGRRKGVE